MSFRLNPFKVMRAVGIVAVVTYGIVLATGYKKSKETTTESVTKEMKIRNKDFYNSKDYKNNLTLPNQVVENNNETVTKELEQAKSSQPINLQQDQIAINPKNVSSQSQTNVKITNDAKKKQEETKLEVKKLEQKKQEEAKIAEQKRQEEAKIEVRQAEIRKQQQEAARKEQARVEAVKQHAKEEAARKAREEAKKNQIKSGSKKYIQVASVTSESSAREIAKKLGGNFYYKKTSVNGRTVYVVMSNMTDNPNTLKTMENQAKKAGSGYMIRSVGK
ncbi:SPOR domain-containing protein [Leptotrichia sp. HSP-342]|uniref:SPOR domain-containing protein n=1 Tax=Leptotrichia mesophila TaxID=3239303 RepID=A0AB39VAK8_9FUSO